MTTHKGNILEHRQFVVDATDSKTGKLTWYTPIQYLKDRYSSIIHSEYENTSSSAGDWDGYIIQRVGRSAVLIPFSQENRWYSFVLNTGGRLASFPYRNWKENFNEFLKFRQCSIQSQS